MYRGARRVPTAVHRSAGRSRAGRCQAKPSDVLAAARQRAAPGISSLGRRTLCPGAQHAFARPEQHNHPGPLSLTPRTVVPSANGHSHRAVRLPHSTPSSIPSTGGTVHLVCTSRAHRMAPISGCLRLARLSRTGAPIETRPGHDAAWSCCPLPASPVPPDYSPRPLRTLRPDAAPCANATPLQVTPYRMIWLGEYLPSADAPAPRALFQVVDLEGGYLSARAAAQPPLDRVYAHTMHGEGLVRSRTTRRAPQLPRRRCRETLLPPRRLQLGHGAHAVRGPGPPRSQHDCCPGSGGGCTIPRAVMLAGPRPLARRESSG